MGQRKNAVFNRAIEEKYGPLMEQVKEKGHAQVPLTDEAGDIIVCACSSRGCSICDPFVRGFAHQVSDWSKY